MKLAERIMQADREILVSLASMTESRSEVIRSEDCASEPNTHKQD
jgi:hypothetical protein